MTASCPCSPPARGGVCFFTAIVVSLCASLTALAANPPELTGRIVDQADIIPAATRSTIEPKLADLETKSGIQLVVATVESILSKTMWSADTSPSGGPVHRRRGDRIELADVRFWG